MGSELDTSYLPLIDARVPRITSHSSQDDDAYRTPAERAEAEARDPLPKLREDLLLPLPVGWVEIEVEVVAGREECADFFRQAKAKIY